MLEEKSEWKRRERRGEEESFPLGFVFFMKDAEYLPKSSGIRTLGKKMQNTS